MNSVLIRSAPGREPQYWRRGVCNHCSPEPMLFRRRSRSSRHGAKALCRPIPQRPWLRILRNTLEVSDPLLPLSPPNNTGQLLPASRIPGYSRYALQSGSPGPGRDTAATDLRRFVRRALLDGGLAPQSEPLSHWIERLPKLSLFDSYNPRTAHVKAE